MSDDKPEKPPYRPFQSVPDPMRDRFALRIHGEQLARAKHLIDLCERLGYASRSGKLTRSDVLRHALELGMVLLEEEGEQQ